ncbi:MAG: septum formation initiator family protein [Eubacteriales bacterium]|jgi:cell division protein DivIC
MRVTRENRITMLVVTLVVCLLCIVLFVQACHMKKQLRAGESEAAALSSEISAERERTKSIESLREQMSSDEYIEQEARERLGLAESDEILFRADDS